MRARDLVEDLPTVTPDEDALDTAALVARRRLPGIAVIDDDGTPVAVLPGSQILRFLVPEYAQEDPALANVLDEGTADACAREFAEHRVGELLPAPGSRVELAAVGPNATVVECAATMARLHSPLLLVVEDGRVRGLLTAAHLLEALLPR